MEAMHREYDHRSIRSFISGGRALAKWLRAAGLYTLIFISDSRGQLSTGAPQEPAKLTPLPHPEIAKPVMMEPGVATWIIVLAVLGLLGLLALLVWLLFRKRPVAVPVSPPPLKQALERMEALRSQVDQLPPSELAHQVSVILRNYQSGRYTLPAPYRTSEELYGDRSIVTHDEHKHRFAPLSAIYDRIEFAPSPATKTEGLDLIDAALQALLEEKRYQGAMAPAPSLPMTEPSAS